jgi:hypothetical protein
VSGFHQQGASMAIMTRRFLFPREDWGAEAIKRAVEQVSTLSLEAGPDEKRALLLVPRKGDLKEHSYYEEIFHKDEIKALSKGSKKSGRNNTTWEYSSFATFKDYSWWDFVVLVFPDRQMLDKVEDIQPRFIMVVPWVDEWLIEWRRVYDPEGSDQKNNFPYQITLAQPVQSELERLTSICKERGHQGMFLHPLDKDKVKYATKTLKRKRIPLDLHAIEVWVRRAGWMPKDAKRLVKIAKGRSASHSMVD